MSKLRITNRTRDTILATEAEAAEKAVEAARKAIEAGGKDRIEAALQELTRASHRLAETLYRTATGAAGEGAGPAAGDPPAQGKGDGDVVDAEVVDKK